MAPDSCRTHLRHALNWRTDGVEAMAGDGLVSMCRVMVVLENVVMGDGPCSETSALNSATSTLGLFFGYASRHGFLEVIRADTGRHIAIEKTTDTAECAVYSLRCE